MVDASQHEVCFDDIPSILQRLNVKEVFDMNFVFVIFVEAKLHGDSKVF